MNRLQADLDAAIGIELLGHMLTDTFWDGFEHDHTFDELLYVLKGPVTLLAGEQSHTLNRGDFALVSKGIQHRITSREPASFLYVGFRTNLFHVGLQMLPKNKTAELAVLALELEDMADKALCDGVPLADFSARLLVNLVPALLSLEQGREEPDPKRILSHKVKQYIKENYHKPIRVDEIAAGLYHSPHYVGNVFAAVNGVTIKEYALQYKMQKAIALLQKGEGSVAQIAARLGYDSPHYFSKCFKGYYSFSPSKLPSKVEVEIV
ncbi:MAG: helix-turn-helix domain-containing protein [Clostridia bacterium]|nr:helix-turn-helix domain-containing protein [Clostridia bacterium]